MNQIIAHRAGAGYELENSTPAFEAALLSGADVIEFDVRLTKDNQLVVCHDANLQRVTGHNLIIAEHNWADLQAIPLKNNTPLLLLADVLKIVKDFPVVIELKDVGSAPALKKVLGRFPKANVRLASFHEAALHQLEEYPRYLLSVYRPFRRLEHYHDRRYAGIGVWYGGLNWYLTWKARKYNLQVYTYTVNNRLLGWLIRHCYPTVSICTDFPNRFRSTNTEEN